MTSKADIERVFALVKLLKADIRKLELTVAEAVVITVRVKGERDVALERVRTLEAELKR